MQKIHHLKELRTSRHLSQYSLAARIHVSRQAYASYENGSRCPALEIVLLLARELHVSTDYLLGKSNSPGTPDASLQPEEQKLLQYYRSTDGRGRAILRRMIVAEKLHYPNKDISMEDDV